MNPIIIIIIISSTICVMQNVNPFVAGYDSDRPEIPSTFIVVRPDFCSFHLEISNCDATRALFKLMSKAV